MYNILYISHLPAQRSCRKSVGGAGGGAGDLQLGRGRGHGRADGWGLWLEGSPARAGARAGAAVLQQQ